MFLSGWRASLSIPLRNQASLEGLWSQSFRDLNGFGVWCAGVGAMVNHCGFGVRLARVTT